MAALRQASALRHLASASADPTGAAHRLASSLRGADAISTLAILHALGGVADPAAEQVLVHTAREAAPTYAAHAAWALGSHRASPAAAAALEALCRRGGLGAMLAGRTLRRWAPALPRALPTPRARRTDGLVIVQPFLHAQLDRAGSGLGKGDAGGIASLLRSLGSALATQRDVDSVLTITRARPGESVEEQLAPGHAVVRIPFGGGDLLPQRETWVYYSQIETALLALADSLAGRRVVWHLRMADVGSLAAAAVARRLGHPVVFTAAPDPHTEIDALQQAHRLSRSRFLVEDAQHHYWFRARVVEQLTAQADRLTILPRPTIERELVELLGVAPADLAARAVTVPEGIDLGEVERARERWTAQGGSAAARAVLSMLPPSRRHLPWLLTVGRLHPAKGVDRLARVVAGNPDLAQRVNLVVVGGDLTNPSPDERSMMSAMAAAARIGPDGVVTCTGHLPPAEVSDLMAHLVAHDGLYVCASAKEEFGLAVVEALAAGAVVVAPLRGGPRTYVEDGITGLLCDTTSEPALRAAIERAFSLVALPHRAERARRLTRNELGVERMAARLADVYRASNVQRRCA